MELVLYILRGNIMENIEFDFKRKEYLLFLQLREKNVNIGVIMLEKEKLVKTDELTKEKY